MRVARTPLLVAAALLASLSVSGVLAPLAAQQDVQVEEADSARLRAMERLRSLARAPGYDSILFAQDSVLLAEAALGNRPGGGTATDSVARALISLPGYTLTEYQGGAADFRTQERILVLLAPEDGRATVSQEGIRAEGDTSVTFDQGTGILQVVGNPSFSNPQGEPINAATMVYDLGQNRGSATGARTSVNEGGANWIVTGDMPYAAQDSSFMSHSRFTSCDLTEPHYHFEADQVKMVGGSTLIARGVRLYFGDVPVFWLPFIAQNLDSERSSGLLRPRFSVNDIVRTSTGYRRRVSNVGFYWAMSDYSDALLSLDWFSDTFWSLTSSTQYRFSRQFLDGSLNLRQYWRTGGSTELALDTRHSWQIDERSALRVSARYAESNDFVRENSFNPREVTQSIDSEGGLNRRFNWGQLAVSANRKQYLSDDRTEWTLPSANLSLSPITLFRAPAADANIWNNMTWSGSSSFQRRTLDRMAADTFSYGLASTENQTAFVRSNLSIGNLTFGQSVNVAEASTLNVPEALLLLGDSASGPDLLTSAPARNIAESNLSWSMSLGYQQQLIGSTTLTPRLSLSGRMLRADTSSLAQDFVSAPTRVAFGAQLKTDMYGFFPGFGSFETIRHKFSPSFDYQWSPESTPDDLQRNVFGARVLQPQNVVSVTLNQTFEAKREEDEATQAAADSVAAVEATQLSGEPRRIPQAEIVSLLALRTSVVRYDFVQADSAGSFLQGFETTRLSNQLSSDLLRGLSVSMDHDLFDDQPAGDGTIAERRFAPHLAQMNLGFALGSRSLVFRWLSSLLGGDATEDAPEEPEGDELNDPFEVGDPTDESSIIPTGSQTGRATLGPRSGSRGAWTANLTYSLQRPRDPTVDPRQMLTGSIRLQPTEQWALSWRTAYDIERGAFNDHSIRLTRDLHRWQANFDFLQTATGNWSFRFEVSLMDNRDLKFDYDQQNLDLGLPAEER
ncbi:MAG: putative LPS assembly protein LptD [Gemmatimonadota bacterium]|nr:putative LPS assembly protein LptD [Gemmatimonadota bacterium]